VKSDAVMQLINKMKIYKYILLQIILLFSLNNLGLAQTYNGEYEEFFFGREPSTSAEATGKIYLVSNDDALASFYNPSYLSHFNTINFSFSTSKKYSLMENASFVNFALKIPFNNLGDFSFSRRVFDLGIDIPITTIENPDGNGKTIRPKEISYNVSFSKMLLKNFHLGIGINYFTSEFFKKINYYTINIGASYFCNLFKNNYYSHKIILGFSLNNLLFFSPNNKLGSITNIQTNTSKELILNLPNISNLTAGYLLNFNGSHLVEGLKDFNSTLQIEYIDVLNSKYWNGVKIGLELRFVEIISVRCGYYNIEYKSNIRKDFTYGFGLSVPFKVFSNFPLLVRFDFTQLEQPYVNQQSVGDFNSLSFRLNYIFN